MKLYKHISNNRYQCFTIELAENYIIDKIYRLFDTNVHSIIDTSNKYLFEVYSITPNTPWVSNVMKICQKGGLDFIKSVSKSDVYIVDSIEDGKLLFDKYHDRMTETYIKDNHMCRYEDTISDMSDINSMNTKYGLALDDNDIEYVKNSIENVDQNRLLIMFDLAQSNSEHCRHHFFNGDIVLDNEPTNSSLFDLVKKPIQQARGAPNNLIAFSDNSSAICGHSGMIYDIINHKYEVIESTIHYVLTSETHNFPTGIAPFQGAATGIGGRLRDVQATGIGAAPVCSSAGYCVGALDNFDNTSSYPDHMATPLDILIHASDGASDYGNKFGEPIILGFTRSFKNCQRDRVEWVKPIMFTGGLGMIKEEHLYKQPIEKDMLVCKIGGPAYRVGFGGGAASSRISKDTNSELDYSAVQRDDAEMEQKMNRVIRECISLGYNNPIVSIHDQGAGGNGNVLKEIIEDKGGVIDIGKITLGDSTMTDIEIWLCEYQESNAVIIKPQNLHIIQEICNRENVQLDVVGMITDTGVLDIVNGDRMIVNNYPLNNKCPTKTYYAKSSHTALDTFNPAINLIYAITQVFQSVSVGSKRFLTNKVDRSVTGLVAQQQCVGPLHTPLSNYGLFSRGFIKENGCYRGCATSIGEQPIVGLVSPISMAHKTFAEMLTNLMFVLVDGITKVSCSANWMWPSPNKDSTEAGKMYAAMTELSRLCCEFGIVIDGGKDSLSMVVEHNNSIIKSPGSLVLSSYARCPNMYKKVTPDLKFTRNKVYFVDLSGGYCSMGGSSLSQVMNNIYTDPPSIRDTAKLKQTFIIIQELLQNDQIVSGHDKSDGGLITTLLEMAFASNIGLVIDLHQDSLIEYLFNEEIGVVFEGIRGCDAYEDMFSKYGIRCYQIATTTPENRVHILNYNKTVLDVTMTELRYNWEMPSYTIEHKQCNSRCVHEELSTYLCFQNPKYNIENWHQYIPHYKSSTYKVAIIREEGSNGDRELGSAFSFNFEGVYDINTFDLAQDDKLLDDFNVIVFVGGFSFADALGSANGWYNVINNNSNIQQQFDRFYHRDDTYSIGICNGCQLMIKLGWIGNGIKLVQNDSGRFESRFSTVKVEKSVCSFTHKLSDLVFGMWVAHGEGKFEISDDRLEELNQNNQVVMRYVDLDSKPTEKYPYNPNGSNSGVAGLCSKNGRHFALMPHPERSFIKWQIPWGQDLINGDYTPWFHIFNFTN